MLRKLIRSILSEAIEKKSLKKILDSDAAYKILDSSRAQGTMWTQGGCAILAFAMNKAYGYPVYVIYDNGLKQADHFVVKSEDGKYIDYRGKHTDLIGDYKEDEMLWDKDLVILPYKNGMNISDIVIDDNASQKLADLIQGKNLSEGDSVNDNFSRWFDGSKVVDASGKPLIVHHGTSKKFSSFNFKNAPQQIIWFTSDKNSIESGDVGAQGKGHIMDLFASIKNPAGWDEYQKYGLGQLEGLGYDGAILPEGDVITGFVFEPTQLKSIKNKGEWNPENKNIFKEKKD